MSTCRVRAGLAGLAVFLIGGAALGFSAVPPVAGELPHVALALFARHPALIDVERGLRADLGAHGLVPDKTVRLTVESAGGDVRAAQALALRLVETEPRVIVAVATPMAQAVAAATLKIPVVFAAVTDPKSAGLVADLRQPGGNVTGVSDLSPVALQIDLVRRILPDAKALAVVYTPNEANAQRLVDLMQRSARPRRFVIVPLALKTGSDPASLVKKHAASFDALFVPTDSGARVVFPSLLAAARAERKPVFGGETALADEGAVAALGFDYEALGRRAGALVRRVLAGESPGRIPVEAPDVVDLAINLQAAAALGLEVSEELRLEADRLVGAP